MKTLQRLYGIAMTISAYNDTPAGQFDAKKATWNELRDRFTTLNTQMEEIEGKYEGDAVNFSPEDSKKYKELLELSEAVVNEQEARPEKLKERRSALNVVPNASALNSALLSLNSRITVGNDLADEDPRFGYKEDKDLLLDVLNFYKDGKTTENLERLVTNTVGSDEYKRGSWKSAGLLIPDGFLNRILRVEPAEDQLLSRMTSVPMSVPSLKIPAAVDKDHSVSFTGNTRVYRTSETNTAPKHVDEFEKVSMEATELIGAAAATQVLMRYSPISIPGLIENSMRLAFRYKRQDEILTGDGMGKYMGVLSPNNKALLSVTRTPGQADTKIISGEDIIRMRKRVWGYNDAVWVFNWDLFETIATLVVESDNNAGIIKIYNPPNGDVPESLLGRPIVWTEFMPGISDSTGATIANWGEAATGNHFAACINMTQYLHGMLYTDQQRSVHVRFDEREEVFQFVMSDDARPHWLTYLTPKRGITTLSPFVALNNTSVD